MNKILILYKSKYGATKKYAYMLKKEIACDVFDIKDYQKGMFDKYELIIFASAIYASGISGLKVLKKNYAELKNKKVIIFCVGASPYDKKAFDEIKAYNLKDDLKDILMFYGRGTWDESKMSFKDRSLCKLLQKAIAKKDPETYEPWMKALVLAKGKKCDWTDRKYIEPIIDYIKNENI